jgi:hypothetical protein
LGSPDGVVESISARLTRLKKCFTSPWLTQ